MAAEYRLGKKIESEIENYFDREISRVHTPPAPLGLYHSYMMERDEENQTASYNFRRRAGFYLFRAAFAAILIICVTAVFVPHRNQNRMAEIITQISEQENLELRVISGLQNAGRFLYSNL